MEARVIWLTGLPSSGKSSIGQALIDEIPGPSELLDSDELRGVLTPRPTYDPSERDWFYDVVGFIAAMLSRHGVRVVVAATAPKRAHRDRARRRAGSFAEVHVACPVDVCKRRDPKGLWRRAASGSVRQLPGYDYPYEEPENPEVYVDSSVLSPSASAREIVRVLSLVRG